jgi:hypothetical protein
LERERRKEREGGNEREGEGLRGRIQKQNRNKI